MITSRFLSLPPTNSRPPARTPAWWAGGVAAALLAVAAPGSPAADGPAGTVSVRDTGPRLEFCTHECNKAHKRDDRRITLDSGARHYTFLYSGCQDPSHGDLRPSAEGNFGMPAPTVANWYWGGFFQVFVNGTDATRYKVNDLRVTEKGARGGFQIVWAHPDADVGLRLLMLPGSNHVLAFLKWTPRAGATLKSVDVGLRCYPSFFTSSRQRKGERHCQTPRIDKREPETLELVPDKDTYLFYYDAVFDPAKGEGDGPCAALVAPDGVQGGKVTIGDYAVSTRITLKPEAGQARLAFYDFAGRKNAEAETYLKAHAAADMARLAQLDFRPDAARTLQPDRLRTESAKLLADAGEDAKTLRPKIEELLARAAGLKAKADAGDWAAEGDLVTALANSEDLFWKLRTFAVLNAP